MTCSPSRQGNRRSLWSRPALKLALACGAAVVTLGGCYVDQRIQPAPSVHAELPDRSDLPEFLRGTLYEKTQIGNNTPYNVSAYGLVSQLHGTGDSTAPNTVRQFMIKELVRRGYGNANVPGFGQISPGQVLRDPNYAIVRVDGFIPPGARKDDFFDVQVSCLPMNTTSSLAHGVLFETDLRNSGANTDNPTGATTVLAKVKGPIFVNPSYALQSGPTPGAAKLSLRKGVVMDNGRVLQDRPIFLQLRHPEKRMSRNIEMRIQERFQDPSVARAEDDGIVNLYVPRSYKGDWQHFTEVVQHIYLQGGPEFDAAKARQLAEEAQKPDAPLWDISYCWEALGKPALPFILPLLTHSSQDVAYAAARAAAFIGDPTGSSETALMRMARTSGHPFQMSSVQALGSLPPTAALNNMLRDLLDSEQPTVRIEAYKVLARNKDESVYSKVIGPSDDPQNQKFVLDIVPGDGPPLIYAARRGWPRIAVIGRMSEIALPITFGAMENRLTISSGEDAKFVTLFYRDSHRRDPVKVISDPDLAKVIALLGGAGPRDEPALDFTYAEVVALVQSLVDEHHVIAEQNGRLVAAAFTLQEVPRMQEALEQAPVISASDSTPGSPGAVDPRNPVDPRVAPPVKAVDSPPSAPGKMSLNDAGRR